MGENRLAGRVRGVGLALACAVALALPSQSGTTPAPWRARLVVAGLVGSPTAGVLALGSGADRGSYVAGSSVLRRPDGSFVLGPARPASLLQSYGRAWDVRETRAALVRRAVAQDRRWLAAGEVPGRTPRERRLAERALLDLHLLSRPDGAVVAAERSSYRFVWPRDASFVAAAMSATGHYADAYAVLAWLASAQDADGTWQARYHPDGSGPVADGRPPQLDADGWVPWAVWSWVRSQQTASGGYGPDVAAGLEALWPAVSRAADVAAASLDDRGLPQATPDWWEVSVPDVTVSTAGTLRAGLRAAAELAAGLGDAEAQQRWDEAATRLDAAITRWFAPGGYHRTPDPGSGADAGMAVLAPPFAPLRADVTQALAVTTERVRTPSGGLRPGEDFRKDPRVAWTPPVGMVMLAAAASGRRSEADHWLGWLDRHTTAVGALPEKVDAAGRPAADAPLAWTDAFVLLALVARDRGLPIPPSRAPGGAADAPDWLAASP